MPYTWANYTTSSSTTWTICPSITSGTITAANITSGTIIQPMWNITAVTDAWGNAYLTPGWQWGWQETPYQQARQQAYQPLSREELSRIADGERQRADERRARLSRVAERAESLLFGLLDEEQARSYLRHGWFEVTGSSGGRYRINRNGQAGNIDELPARGDQRVASLCIHPYGGFHDADAHAAQYLALVTDEESFRRTANRTPRRRLAAA